ncbi:MAG TPA: amidohydrolase family protein [Chthoniobacterales bacterium]|nr:amidohydrolase family protein [Chthoniobacterales bacterium]
MIPGCARIASVFLCFAAVFGCKSTGPRLTPEQIAIRTDLEKIEPREYACARESPILDIHTHTFNARYLPLRGILEGKRDAFPPLTWLISDDCAATLAHALVERTELASAAGQKGVNRVELASQSHNHRDGGFICRIFLGLLDKAATKGAWQKGMSSEAQLDAIDKVAEEMNLMERTAVMTATHMMGMEHEVDMSTNGLRGAVRFLWLLTQSDAHLPGLFRMQLEGPPMLGKPLMVSHMMDLAPVYNQMPDAQSPDELLDFEEKQLPRMAEFQSRPDSNLIYFVAYNPYRDHWGRDSGRSGSLELVEKAIEENGAWGVKVYPPSGYRPSGNAIRNRPSGIRSRIAAQQYDARYGPLPGDKNKALDQKLRKLLEWCIKNDRPVFVHAGTGEFEAQKGYGFYHSDPAFWQEFLKDHPTLRLCLGHAGGADLWFGGKKATKWGEAVYQMCRTYPNVYCEITTHAELVSPDKQAYFVDQLARKFKETENGAGPYEFSKKLIYGSDWYLPDASERATVLLAAQKAWLHGSIRKHYRDYFFGNALRYLNVEKRLKEPGHRAAPIDDRLREALTLAEATEDGPCTVANR